ncbi:MAG: DUF4129 domain-containing protein [Pirellulaceae bacterium]
MKGPAAAIGCWLACCLAWGADDRQSDVTSSVLVAREVLRTKSDLPWYDPDTDALHRIEVTPDEDDPYRHSSWAADRAPNAATTSANAPSTFWKFMQVIAWIVLGGLLAAVMWLLVRAAQRLDVGNSVEPAVVDRAGSDAQRMEDLPINVPPSDHDLLAAARACYEAGDYGKAITYAYAYQLVELDKRHLVQLSKGKTNRQYLRELRMKPGLQILLRETMLAFEDVFFGHHALSKLRFQHCWDSLDEFHRQLEQPA